MLFYLRLFIECVSIANTKVVNKIKSTQCSDIQTYPKFSSVGMNDQYLEMSAWGVRFLPASGIPAPYFPIAFLCLGTEGNS